MGLEQALIDRESEILCRWIMEKIDNAKKWLHSGGRNECILVDQDSVLVFFFFFFCNNLLYIVYCFIFT